MSAPYTCPGLACPQCGRRWFVRVTKIREWAGMIEPQESLAPLGVFEPEAWGCVGCGCVIYVGTVFGAVDGYIVEP